MKKWISSFILLMLVLSGCASSTPKATLKVFSWGEYIDPSVITEFEQINNVKVIYDVYSSNEEMHTKIQSGSEYDIVVPTDWMIERLISEDRLAEIDLSLITNFDGLMPSTLGRDYDHENKYSVPYFGGDIGIIYNTQNVDENDVITEGWEVLRNPKYDGQIFMYDSERDNFMVALKALGYSVNTTDRAEIDAAYQWLVDMSEQTHPVYAAEELIDQMISESKDMAVTFSGDASYMLSENENLTYYVPKEMGTNIWQDAMVILKESENYELAHKWIDFMISPEVALTNTLYVGYTTPVQSVFDEVTGPGGAYEKISSYKISNYPTNEIYQFNQANVELFSDLWFRVKAN